MYDPEQHHRRSVRLREVSYAEPGVYFITVCAYERECLFGEVVDGEMRLNGLGEIVDTCWRAIPAHFPQTELDAYVVMPNHVHGIIGIIGGDGGGAGIGRIMGPGAACCAPTKAPTNGGSFVRNNVEAGSLGAIVRSFKSAVTKRINMIRGTPGAPVWQRSYWDHIVRNEADLERIRRYIGENPGRWGEDRLYLGPIP